MNKKIILKPEIVAVIRRNSNIENIYSGWICIINDNKEIQYKKGNIKDKTFLRSVCKPIQAIPILDTNIQVSQKELAIICGSHHGNKKHLEVLKKLLVKFSVNPIELQCGIHMPFDEAEKKYLIKNNKIPTVLHNNCSGKHTGMIAVCREKNWKIQNYLDLNHPLQKSIIKTLKELSEYAEISYGVDGCGAPTFCLPILNISYLFSNFTKPKEKKHLKIIQAIKNYPFYLGGDKQIDSELIKASGGNLISKVGAGGLIVISRDGNSIVVKIADGSSLIRETTAVRLLVKRKWITLKQIKDTILEEYYYGEIKNHAGKIVGSIESLID